MTYETISVSIDRRGVAMLTLCRPARHNALSGAMIVELTAAAARLAGDPSVRIVILTGDGESFCAGGDLSWMRAQISAGREQRIAEARKLALMLKGLQDLPKPLIGRINGQAYGGGIGLISVCDAAISVADATFGLTETRLGLIPATISPYVIARIGASHAMRLFTSARVFSAADAQAYGLVHGVVAREDLDAAVEAEIKPYFKTAPGAVAAAKALVHAVSGPRISEMLDMTLTRLADTWETEEAAEGVDAFLKKRRPDWSL